MNYKKIYAIKKANEERILKVCPNCPNTSGIYFLLREEDGFKYAYIGQAVRLRERLGSHLSGYQHIDLSIKKHGLWSEENPTGYKVHFLEFDEIKINVTTIPMILFSAYRVQKDKKSFEKLVQKINEFF